MYLKMEEYYDLQQRDEFKERVMTVKNDKQKIIISRSQLKKQRKKHDKLVEKKMKELEDRRKVETPTPKEQKYVSKFERQIKKEMKENMKRQKMQGELRSRSRKRN